MRVLDVNAEAELLEHASLRFDHLVLGVVVGLVDGHRLDHPGAQQEQVTN